MQLNKEPNEEEERFKIVLANLTTGAIWEPLFFKFCRASSHLTRLRKSPAPRTQIAGLGSILVTLSNWRPTKRFFAIYRIDEELLFSDGKKEMEVSSISTEWSPLAFPFSTLGLASLRIETPQSLEEIIYFRPSLRHAFEGGWSLNDVDILKAIDTYSNNHSARHRLFSTFPRKHNE